MVDVGGAFLAAFLQVLFDRLASRKVLKFFRGRMHDDRLLKKLKLMLLTVSAVLNDAEEKQITNTDVKNWLDELKDAFYEADDLLDETATEALQSELQAESQSGTNQVKDLIFASFSSFDDDIEFKIKQIIERLQHFAQEKDILGLKEGVGSKQSLRRQTTSLIDEFGVYGRDNEKAEIINLLLSNDASGNETSVITIVGMVGIGKTTLAQIVYNDGRVDEHFDTKAWVCVSEEFDVFRVTETFFEAVTLLTCDFKDLNLLQIKLKDFLMGKKFLLVLDDVWIENYDEWDILQSPFRAGAYGSKVVITTRNESVASIMQTIPIHHLKKLSYEDCWSLFKKHAFRNGDPSAHPKLEVIGKEIVRKCKGLPLAAKTLGALLRSKVDVEEWDNVLKSSIWDLPNNKSNILPTLRLSYHYLPSHLKRCFVYCSIFPKDYEFDREELIRLWIAEDFVQQPKSNRRMEDVGDEYFRELLSRSFFQQSAGNKLYFLMHDLVHDLAQFIAGEFCLRLEDKPHDISEKLRHFSFVRGKYDTFERFKAIKEAKCLRTFLSLKLPCSDTLMYLTSKVLYDVLPTLQCLRVLSLSHYKIIELPCTIGNLIHLRYLDLSHTEIRRLPKSVSTLCNLQTLDLSHCHFLTELPMDMEKLICLRHLDISGTNLREMPMQLGRLKTLQCLTAFVVGKHSGSRINELKELCHLHGTLSILNLQNVLNVRDASEANLKDKKHLEKLVLEWGGRTDDSQNERDVLEKLQPHTNVKNITVKNYGGTRFPDWLGDHSFSNIVFLCLDSCAHCFFLPPLGQLPSLKDLTIGGMNEMLKVGPEFYGDGSFIKPFQSLERLRFDKMTEWEEWYMPGVGEFYSLLELYIIYCPKLKGDLPRDIPSLRRLEISGCQQLVASLPDSQVTILFNQVGLLQNLSTFENLKISDLSTLKELPPELCRLTNLQELKIEGCPSLLSFPVMGLPSTLRILRIENCDALQSLPGGMTCINTCLQSLSISGCSSLMSLPIGGLPSTLKRLDIDNCRNLEFPLSEEMEWHTSLEHLFINQSCDSLKSFPLSFFPKLSSLIIWKCSNFETLLIPNRFHNLTSLHSLEFQCCPNMVSFPEGGLPTPNLTWFWIFGCKNLKSLPERMCTLLTSLQTLVIDQCPEIDSFPDGGLPSNLRTLSINDCNKLMSRRMEWGLQRLPSLIEVTIIGGSEDLQESFPEEWLLPSTVTFLSIWGLPNLKSLNLKGLQYLNSLETLIIWNCPKLSSLPEEGLPTSLSMLEIMNCPLLKPRCQKKGRDWHKIAHIPCIKLDDEITI